MSKINSQLENCQKLEKRRYEVSIHYHSSWPVELHNVVEGNEIYIELQQYTTHPLYYSLPARPISGDILLSPGGGPTQRKNPS